MSRRVDVGVLRTQLAGIVRAPLRLVLTGLPVLVAAFFACGAALGQVVAERAVLDGLGGTPAAVDLVVDGGPLTGAGVDRVRATPGVAEVQPRVSAGAVLADAADRYLGLEADPGDGPLSLARVVDGRYPGAADEIAVNEVAAAGYGLKSGDRTTLVLPVGEGGHRDAEVLVTGVVRVVGEKLEAAYAPTEVITSLVDLPAEDGWCSRLDVRLADGADPGALMAELAAVTGADGEPVRVETGDAVRLAEARAATGDVDDLFAGIALFVGISVVAAALVAASAFRVVFSQRLKQLALLRVVGAHRGQLVRALVVEGVVVGLVAGGAGVATAVGLVRLLPLVSDLPTPETPVAWVLGVVVGAVAVTVLSVLGPAVSASRVSPLQALRGADVVPAERALGPLRLAAGVLLAALAAGVVVLLARELPGPGSTGYDRDAGLVAVAAVAVLLFLALLLLGPLVVRPVLAAVGPAARRLGPVGRLAVSGVGGAPRRAAAVSLVVALGVALVSGALVGRAGLAGYAERELGLSAPADLRVTGASEETARRVAGLPEVVESTDYRTGELTAGNRHHQFADLDLGALEALRDNAVADSGSLADLRAGRIVVGGRTARSLGVTAGDAVRGAVDGREVTWVVAATLTGTDPAGVGVVVPRGQAPGGEITVLVSGDPVVVERAVRAAVGDGGEVTATRRDQGDLREVVDLLALVGLGLIGLTVLVAVVGVGATTGLGVVERTREIGVLRALGMGPGGVWSVVVVEAGIHGVLGAVLGLAVGVPCALLGLLALDLGVPLVVPAPPLAGAVVGVVALTALAGWVGARRAVRVSPVAALRADS
ncbi:ABC transporter permease [Actinosynnema pretiosum subsp. pretiosum]|uniref:ABC transporter permease n=1 Tax=Actinosynnema pretiosum subsp. pretiosum TaxID=103721 RepID=A0AA45R497_9PSEU|nr:ABC transporter, permease protein [Actinosynnema pretiosum subsp. pretiosum]QUF04549.1 ABC transporter permease [Actinosynnema pretiosum subsp. pretiosum]